MTLTQLALRYVAGRTELSRASRQRYRLTLQRFAETVGVGTPDELDADVIRRWVSRWNRGQSTLSAELSIIRGFCQWLTLEGHCTQEPTLGVRVPRVRRKRTALTEEQTTRVLAIPSDTRTRLLVSLTIREGLRPNEIATLETRAVDLERRTITISGRHARTLPLTHATTMVMHAYLVRRRTAGERLIVSEHHDTITPGRVGDLVRAVLRAAGVKQRARDGVDTQGLRFTTMTRWRERGVDPAGIAQAGGYTALAEIDAQQRPWVDQDLARIVG